MIKYFLRLILLLACVVGVIALIGSVLPRGYDFETSVVVDAPPEEVFAAINRLRNWPQWSEQFNPEAIDDLTIDYNAVDAGEGAALIWNDVRGRGKLWITSSVPSQSVFYDVEFQDFPVMNSEIKLTEDSEAVPPQTVVSWRSKGSLPGGPFYGFFGNFYSTQMRYMYDNSLQGLKRYVED
ncbi:MAG: SRPBCC family protein [Planctomycetota bacterium]